MTYILKHIVIVIVGFLLVDLGVDFNELTAIQKKEFFEFFEHLSIGIIFASIMWAIIYKIHSIRYRRRAKFEADKITAALVAFKKLQSS